MCPLTWGRGKPTLQWRNWTAKSITCNVRRSTLLARRTRAQQENFACFWSWAFTETLPDEYQQRSGSCCTTLQGCSGRSSIWSLTSYMPCRSRPVSAKAQCCLLQVIYQSHVWSRCGQSAEKKAGLVYSNSFLGNAFFTIQEPFPTSSCIGRIPDRL